MTYTSCTHVMSVLHNARQPRPSAVAAVTAKNGHHSLSSSYLPRSITRVFLVGTDRKDKMNLRRDILNSSSFLSL